MRRCVKVTLCRILRVTVRRTTPGYGMSRKRYGTSRYGTSYTPDYGTSYGRV